MARIVNLLFVSAVAGCSATIHGTAAPDAGSNGSNGNGSNTGNGGPDAACPDVAFSATRVTPSIQLLIDRSGSMDTLLPNSSTTRYQAIQNALVGSGGVVAQLQSSVYFGASLFTDDAPCPTLYTKPRALNNESTIAALIASQSPNGNTPTSQSIALVVQDFMANPPPQGSPPAIVLATDGLPNSCTSGNDTSAETVQAAQAAYAAGVRLYIIGIAGVANTFLQDMANAGTGLTNAPYYTSDSPASMTQAFQQIIGGVLSCDLTINGTIDPTQASTGTVVLDGTTLTYGADWTVINGNTLELLGAACTTLKSSPNPTVTATFSCTAVIQ